jgi:hypothetical protein
MINDPTTKYLLMIVGIVALVGIVYMASLPSVQDSNVESSDAITGNVVLLEDYSTSELPFIEYGAILRTLLGLGLVGACVFMYHKF